VLKKIIKGTDYIEVVIIAILMTALLGLMMFNVVARYVFAFGLAWAEQMSRLLFVWSMLIGISYAAKKYAHLRVSALAFALKGRKEKILMLIGDIIATAFAFYMAYRILLITLDIYAGGSTFSAMPAVPVWTMYLAGIFGMGGLAIRNIQFAIIPGIKTIREFNKHSGDPITEGGDA